MNMYKLSKKSTRALCEGGIMVALAVILGMLRLYRLPNGGSITISVGPNVVLTLILFALLHRVKPIRKQLLPEEL